MADLAKRCTFCGETKPLSEFNRRRASSDGLQVRCKACIHAPKVGPIHMTCSFCGVDFQRVPTGRTARGGYSVYCSAKCQSNGVLGKIRERRRAEGKHLRSCPVCDQEFEFRSRGGNDVYCSESCKYTAKRVRGYGGTIEDMKRLRVQDDCCAACGGDFHREDGWGRVLDHCHDTGKLRGFLHQGCNTGIGHAKDDPELLWKWQVYLARHQFDLRDLCPEA